MNPHRKLTSSLHHSSGGFEVDTGKANQVWEAGVADNLRALSSS